MPRTFIFLCLFGFTSCFNGQNSVAESEPQDFCGTVGFSSSEMESPPIFKAKCATCHMFSKDVTGPRMDGVLNRVPSEEWLKAFITNQDSLIEVKDEYTLEIMTWSPVNWNHNFADLEENDLDTLMAYITQ